MYQQSAVKGQKTLHRLFLGPSAVEGTKGRNLAVHEGRKLRVQCKDGMRSRRSFSLGLFIPLRRELSDVASKFRHKSSAYDALPIGNCSMLH